MKAIVFHLFIILILSMICSNSAIDIECNDESTQTLDLMIQRLYLFGAEDRLYPTSKKEMKSFCSSNTEYQKWLKEYSAKCLKGLSKQVLSLLMYSVSKNTNGICRSERRTKEFLEIGSCGNSAKKETTKCWNELTLSVDSASYHKNNKMKIPLSCCYYHNFQACNQRAYESKPKQCGPKALDGHEKLINMFVLDTLKLLCSDYMGDNDKCDKLLMGVKVKSNLKVVPKSPIAVFIKILDSL